MRKDPYLYRDNVIRRLINEYSEHGKIIVAFDFDGTVFDYHGVGDTYPRVESLLRELKPHAHLIVYTASKESRIPFIAKYLTNRGIPFDGINKLPPNLEGLSGGKMYYNILLDDRAGLGEAVQILEEFLNVVSKYF